jgi:hypothetical protein
MTSFCLLIGTFALSLNWTQVVCHAGGVKRMASQESQQFAHAHLHFFFFFFFIYSDAVCL